MGIDTVRPSIVLITIDCLRNDRIGYGGYGRSLTPFIDQMAQDSIMFRRAYVAGSPTYNSFPAILGGRFPYRFGRDISAISSEEITLSSALRDNGYRTGAIMAGNPYVSKWLGYERGFDYFDDNLISDKGKQSGREKSRKSIPGFILERITSWSEIVPPVERLLREGYFQYRIAKAGKSVSGDYVSLLRIYPDAETITDKAVEWLGSDQEPFFLWVHYMDAHRPYCPPQWALREIGRDDIDERRMYELRELWLRRDVSLSRLEKEREDFLALYDAGICSIDHSIQRLFNHISKKMNLDNVIFALTSDHGEAFLERGERDHDPVLVTEEMVRVPLMLGQLNRNESMTYSKPFSHIDLAPTILGMAGLDRPDAIDGRNRIEDVKLGNDCNEFPVIELMYGYDIAPKAIINPPRKRLTAVVDDRFKLVMNFSNNECGLYDLELDPHEEQLLPLMAHKEMAAKLLDRLRSHLMRYREMRGSWPEIQIRLKVIREKIRLNETSN